RKYARYLCSKGLKTAVLLNDFGAGNIDMMMLSDIKSENCKVEMIVGGADADCHKRRFKTQLISLGMQHFDRIIIEPSGIFDMDEFFDTLH
ncbi:GTPase (G3E family), partial [Pseudomonas aeruginosa]